MDQKKKHLRTCTRVNNQYYSLFRSHVINFSDKLHLTLCIFRQRQKQYISKIKVPTKFTKMYKNKNGFHNEQSLTHYTAPSRKSRPVHQSITSSTQEVYCTVTSCNSTTIHFKKHGSFI